MITPKHSQRLSLAAFLGKCCCRGSFLLLGLAEFSSRNLKTFLDRQPSTPKKRREANLRVDS